MYCVIYASAGCLPDSYGVDHETREDALAELHETAQSENDENGFDYWIPNGDESYIESGLYGLYELSVIEVEN